MISEQSYEEWLDVWSEILWIILILIALFFMIYWSKAAYLWNGDHYPVRACIAGIVFFILGIGKIIADDGGLGEDLDFPSV